MKKNTILVSLAFLGMAMSIQTISGFAQSHIIARAADSHTVSETTSLAIIGTNIKDVAAWSPVDMTYDDTTETFTLTVEMTAENGVVTIKDTDSTSSTYNSEYKNPLINDAAWRSSGPGKFLITVSKTASENSQEIYNNNGSGDKVLYITVEQIRTTSFTEETLLDFYANETSWNNINFSVNENGDVIWPYELFINNGVAQSDMPIEALRFYIFGADETELDVKKSLGYFDINYFNGDSVVTTQRANLESNKLVFAGIDQGEASYKFAARLIAKKGCAYSSTGLFPFTSAATYTVQEDVNGVFGNVALGKSVLLSSLDHSNAGSNVVDGNVAGAGWRAVDESNGYINSYVQIDLGGNYSLNEIRVYWEAACASAYDIYLLDDSITADYAGDFSEFAKLATGGNEFIGGTNPVDVLNPSTETQGRYLILNCVSPASPYGNFVYEIKAYGQEVKEGDVSLYGAQYGTKTDGASAIRFIGQIANVDLTTYTSTISFRVTYKIDDTTAVGTSAVSVVYDTLVAKEGVEALPQEEGSYYFCLLIKNIPAPIDNTCSFFVEILVDGVLVDNATYKLSIK